MMKGERRKLGWSEVKNGGERQEIWRVGYR